MNFTCTWLKLSINFQVVLGDFSQAKQLDPSLGDNDMGMAVEAIPARMWHWYEEHLPPYA